MPYYTENISVYTRLPSLTSDFMREIRFTIMSPFGAVTDCQRPAILRMSVAPLVFIPGVVMFVSMQMLQRYEGDDINIKRLRRIMLMSDVLLLLSALLMYAGNGNPFKLDQITYVQYIGNNWVVVLLIAALLQLFTSFRIGKELEKEK